MSRYARETDMRVMVMGKATGATGNGAATDPEALEAMSRFNEELMPTSSRTARHDFIPID